MVTFGRFRVEVGMRRLSADIVFWTDFGLTIAVQWVEDGKCVFKSSQFILVCRIAVVIIRATGLRNVTLS